MRLIARDEKVFSYPPGYVYAVLCDFESYAAWWPCWPSVRVIGAVPAQVGSAIRLANSPFVRWTATVIELYEPDFIKLAYSDGSLRGGAAWTLAPEGGGTRVAYEIDVEPKAQWLRLLSAVFDLRREHSRQIHRVFAALEDRLGRLAAVSRRPR